MTIPITAIICTYNRFDYLQEAVASLTRQTLDPSRYEILVVDNSASGKVQDLLCGQFPHTANLRVIREPLNGHSRARNTGWRMAQSDYIAYLDDDALAAPDWLEKILQCFQTLSPKPGCVAGRIKPLWEASPPSWLHEKFFRPLGLLDYSKDPGWIDDPDIVTGTNMSFPRKVLEESGGFCADLGRKAKRLLCMDEVYLCRSLKKKGHRFFYEPAACVQHRVSRERLTQGWFLERFETQGLSEALIRMRLEPVSSREKAVLRLRAAAILTALLPREFYEGWLPVSAERFLRRCRMRAQIAYCRGLLGREI